MSNRDGEAAGCVTSGLMSETAVDEFQANERAGLNQAMKDAQSQAQRTRVKSVTIRRVANGFVVCVEHVNYEQNKTFIAHSVEEGASIAREMLKQ